MLTASSKLFGKCVFCKSPKLWSLIRRDVFTCLQKASSNKYCVNGEAKEENSRKQLLCLKRLREFSKNYIQVQIETQITAQ